MRDEKEKKQKKNVCRKYGTISSLNHSYRYLSFSLSLLCCHIYFWLKQCEHNDGLGKMQALENRLPSWHKTRKIETLQKKLHLDNSHEIRISIFYSILLSTIKFNLDLFSFVFITWTKESESFMVWELINFSWWLSAYSFGLFCNNNANRFWRFLL